MAERVEATVREAERRSLASEPPEPPGSGEPAEAAEAPPAVAGDELPADLDVTAFVGPYTFPDISRRRIAGT